MSQFGSSKSTESAPSSSSNDPLVLHQKIVDQGNAVRTLKANKASKDQVTAAVNELLTLKKSFKDATGVDWKPDIDMSQFGSSNSTESAPTAPSNSSNDPHVLHQKVVDQGNAVRTLKANKASKDQVTAAVNELLTLKKSFKDATGVDWKPDIDMSQFGSSKSTESAPTAPSSSSNDPHVLHQKVVDQGNVVRTLKSNKASKEEVTAAVGELLALKKVFKEVTGVEWKPDIDMSQFSSAKSAAETPKVESTSDPSDPHSLHQKVVDQGNAVRTLKSNKAPKDEITAAVNVLLSLKKAFKEATGVDWKPDIDISQFKKEAATAEAPSTSSGALGIHNKIVEQGNKVRNLKSSKASKEDIKAAVDVLLQLKQEFKTATNIDWKPDIDTSKFSSSQPEKPSKSDTGFAAIHEKIVTQGNKVRQMKSSGASKPDVKAEVDQLLALKAEFKSAAGVDWKPDIDISSIGSTPKAAVTSSVKSESKEKQRDSSKKAPKKEEAKAVDGKKQTRLGLECAKEENLSEWYSQVITKSEMIEYYNVSGCYILRPWSFSIWETIKDYIDRKIKRMGVENCSFPMFVSRDALEKEKTHIADFSPEVAWVTKSGSSDLAEPIAIRPTSETVMYPAYAKWIKSHRDLPMCLNQWNSVVRWEFKQPTPFLRTREFLWQEGHTAFATKAEATEEVYKILDIYAEVYEDLLAIPVVKGKKTEKEKFAGGDFTTTTEAFICASGRAIQGSTSHHLGQNFSKMFNILFEDQNGEKKLVYQNSWGMTTRTIGVMVMVHGDNKGLVLPPRVARLQAVIMPVGITAKVTEEQKAKLSAECRAIEKELKNIDIRCQSDLRDHITPAWKFNDWELKGVPLRLELGPREVENAEVFVVRRDTGEKQAIKRADIAKQIPVLLDTIHKAMFDKANEDLQTHMKVITKWEDFCTSLDGGNLNLVPYCGVESCEDRIKKDSARDQDVEPGAPSMGAKSLCIPFQQPKALVPGTACIHPACNSNALHYCLFGRSY